MNETVKFPNSDLYYFIATVAQQYAIDHVGDRFEDEYTGEFYSYDEDTFSCNIYFDYIIKYDDADDVVYASNYRFYLVERDDQWYLYDFKMVNG